MGKRIREEKDQEGGMAKVEIDSIERAVQNLKKKITKSDQQLPAWVQSKITRAADYINSASQYLMSGEELDENKSISFEINKPKSKPEPKPEEHQRTPEQIENERQFFANLHHRMKTDPDPQFQQFVSSIQKVGREIKANQPQPQPQPQQAAKKKGPQLPNIQKESLSLADKILEEMGCGCDKMKSHKTPEQIAKKHNVPVEEVLKQLKAGTKVEFEHTNSKKEAEAIALQHLNERPDYYNRLKKVEATNENVTVTDMFGNPTYEFIDLIKPDPIISEGRRKRKKMKGEDPCWKGYEMVGKKMKGGREVPNCVPINEFLNPVRKFQRVLPVTNRAFEIDRKIQKLNLDKEKQRQKIIQQQRSGDLPYSGATGLPTMEEEVIPTRNGQVMLVTALWRGKYLGIQMFFPQTRIPNRSDVQDAVSKVYPDARLVTYKVSTLTQDMPLIQIQNSPSKNYKLNSGIIGEESEKSKMPCNKPKAEPHGSGETGKSHVVKACSGGKQKLIRFGQLGVKGSPKKEGESKEYADRRRRFKKRHSKNIKKGPMSAAYWANKVKW